MNSICLCVVPTPWLRERERGREIAHTHIGMGAVTMIIIINANSALERRLSLLFLAAFNVGNNKAASPSKAFAVPVLLNGEIEFLGCGGRKKHYKHWRGNNNKSVYFEAPI